MKKLTIKTDMHNPEITVSLNEKMAMTTDVELKGDVSQDAIFIGLKHKDFPQKKDLVCLKTTDNPNILRLCLFTNPESEDPEQEIFLDLTEFEQNM